jgi:nitrogenase-associated protein
MAYVIFYEKPGCANNARQKQLLSSAGHSLELHDLLTEPWTGDRLRSFFGALPVAEWFNRAAPKVKSGVVDPTRLDASSALALMLEDPILIRRPLIEVDGDRRVGFDPVAIDSWIGLHHPRPDKPSHDGIDLETCRRKPADETQIP